MAQGQDVKAGEKRGPGRPPKSAQPALKKARTSSIGQSPLSSNIHSPSAQSPAPEKRLSKLPFKISDLRPLPTLSDPQSPAVPVNEYQSIAASAVLQSSLDRSRLAWVHDGVFERYWTKPESGKNARPLPPNNPEVKWQKHRGPCRIRIEPHIFEAEMYVEEKPRPPAPVKQYTPNPNFQQPYRPPQQYGGQAQGSPYYQNQNRNLPPPIQQPGGQNPNTLPPISQPQQAPPPQSRPQPSPQPQQSGQEKKASPDPVISMLANRASSDPELKALMKEVATGNATQDQLKVFQGHIDELTKIINEKKKKEEESSPAPPKPSQGETIQYDGAADGTLAAPPAPATPVQQQPRPPYQPQQPMYQHQQPTWTPPPPPPPAQPAAPASLPVVLQFTTQGATEDRFLFPQHSILESLSPQHLLASFLVTRKPSALSSAVVADLSLDPQKEYYQAITLMVEVAYNRESLLEHVKRWVKPPEEARKHMEEVMERCERAPERYLALRLPVKGSKEAADADEVAVVEALALQEKEKEKEKEKERKSVKYVKKKDAAQGSGTGTPVGKKDGEKKDASPADGGKVGVNGTPATNGTPAQATAAVDALKKEEMTAGDSAANGEKAESEKRDGEEQATTETGRPRRATRKSARISEG